MRDSCIYKYKSRCIAYRVGICPIMSCEMNDELSQTLAELCDDLFSVNECDENARAILLSLATLASGFPRAQKAIGRLFAQRRAGVGSISSCYLSLFADRFLYDPLTSKEALGLLAIISHRNVRNQTRIVQEVAGVRILRHRSKKGSDLILYTLTIPSAVKQTYKSWIQRHRALANHRIPCGQPPTHDGIPMPCYCNSCLGTDQFLPTWRQHFHNLSQWANSSSNNQEPISLELPSARALSSAAFYSLYLQSHRMFTYSPQEVSDSSCNAVLYYFAPENDSDSTQPPFDPLQHLSAIEIAGEVDVPVKTSLPKHEKEIDHPSLVQAGNDNDVPLESVTLLETQVALRSCRQIITRDQEIEVDPVQVTPPAGLSVFLESVELEEGELVTPSRLVDQVAVSFQLDQLSVSEAHLLRCILEFCGDEDLISVSALRSIVRTSPSPADSASASDGSQTVKEQEQPDAKTECELEDTICDATVIAQVHTGELVIQCVDRSDEARRFRAIIQQQHILADSDELSLQGNQFALLYIKESALSSILAHCVACECPGVHEVSKPIVLLRKQSLGTATLSAGSQCAEEALTDTQANAPNSTTPLPGLSPELHQLLQIAGAAFEGEENSTAETVHRFLESLVSIVGKCNERITFLASSSSRAMKAIPNAHRSAAMIRCRLCRDHVIRLSKTLKLQQSSSGHSLIPPKRFARMKALVRQTLQSVHEQSEQFEAWEIPDERVAKLHLSRQLWASGFPDAAFYQQSERVARENRSRQRHLSARLRSQKARKSIQ